MLLLHMQEYTLMRRLIIWLFGSKYKNNLESNLKEYEANRKVHNN
jgi:hypothetical protein